MARGIRLQVKNRGKLIQLHDYKKSKVGGELRKYPDYYEHILIPNYESIFTDTQMQSIEMEDCFANLLIKNGCYVLVSLSFDEYYTVQEIMEWLELCEIILKNPTSSPIKVNGVSSIVEAKKFNNYPILLVEKGMDTLKLNPEELNEITDSYSKFNKITPIGRLEVIEWKETYLDKDDHFGRAYPGIKGEPEENFESLKAFVHYSAYMRGLFIECQSCTLESVVIHERTIEIEQPKCPHCGHSVDAENCEWIKGPI